jgi:tetratricopeptide (TPR) repeat protein
MIGQTISHYEVLEKIGEGGMGVVYKARDTLLGRLVALKTLPAGGPVDPDRQARLLREARAASALHHPNIVAVHDLLHHEGSDVIVMELVTGRTLDRAVAGKPLREVLGYARQIADALAKAHAAGIVHRDLKPSNVMVDEGGTVRILDFGLARFGAPQGTVDLVGESARTSAEATGTADGHIVGTLAYMSPEQAEGKKADARSDVFSFGTVLYEMVTGRMAFRGDSAAATLAAVMERDPPPPREVVPGLPADLEKLIQRCLRKDPAKRFQSMGDVALDLDEIAASVDSVRARARAARLPRRKARLLAGVALLVLAALVATAIALWLPGRARPPVVTLDPKRVVIAVFENRTGDASLNALGTLVPEALAQEASGIGDFTVIPSPASLGRGAAGGETAAGERALRQLAQETAAGVVVSGAYYLLGEDLRIQSQLTDAISGRLIHTAEAVTGPRVSQAEVIDKLRQRVLGAVAAHFDPQLSQGRVRWPLLDAYLEFRRGAEASNFDHDVAKKCLERTLDLDPDFFVASIPLYWDYFNLHQCDEAARVLERFERRQGRLTPYERLLYATVRASLEGRWNEQLRVMREQAAQTPDDLGLKYNIGFRELFVRRPHEAVAMLAEVPSSWVRSTTGGPVWWPAYFLALAHHRLGDYEKELTVVRQNRQHFPEVLELRAREVAALAALRGLDQAQGTVEDAVVTPAQIGSLGRFLVLSAGEMRAHGHQEAAQRLADRAVAWFAERPAAEQPANRPVQLLALALGGRWQEAKQAAEALPEKPVDPALDLLTIFWGQPAVYRLGWIGTIAARLGDALQARRLSGQLRDFRSRCPVSHRTYWRTAIAAQLAEKDEAKSLFEEAVAQESVMVWQADHDFLLESLWDEPRFRALVRPYEVAQPGNGPRQRNP